MGNEAIPTCIEAAAHPCRCQGDYPVTTSPLCILVYLRQQDILHWCCTTLDPKRILRHFLKQMYRPILSCIAVPFQDSYRTPSIHLSLLRILFCCCISMLLCTAHPCPFQRIHLKKYYIKVLLTINIKSRNNLTN